MPRAGEKPAQVSGPGRYSKRTDQGKATQPTRAVTGGEYGDNQELQTLQGSAPMSASARTPQQQAGGPPPQAAPQGPPGFGDPTQRPEEPVTAGNPMGPGMGAPSLPGLEAPPSPEMTQLVALLPVLTKVANGPNGTPALRNLVRYMNGRP